MDLIEKKKKKPIHFSPSYPRFVNNNDTETAGKKKKKKGLMQ
jgi:hypothetical protein